jgi:LEA14-like dessication related protein
MNRFGRNGIKTIVCVAGIAVLCSFKMPLQKPDIKYDKYEVKKITFRDTRVDFLYLIDNPNPVGLKNIMVDYKMYLGYKDSPAKGTPPTMSGKDVKVDVKKKAVSVFRLPMTINYEGFFKSAKKLKEIIIGGQKTIPFVLQTTFKLNLNILKFDIPVEVKGELPLPELSAKDLLKHKK